MKVRDFIGNHISFETLVQLFFGNFSNYTGKYAILDDNAHAVTFGTNGRLLYFSTDGRVLRIKGYTADVYDAVAKINKGLCAKYTYNVAVEPIAFDCAIEPLQTIELSDNEISVAVNLYCEMCIPCEAEGEDGEYGVIDSIRDGVPTGFYFYDGYAISKDCGEIITYPNAKNPYFKDKCSRESLALEFGCFLSIKDKEDPLKFLNDFKNAVCEAHLKAWKNKSENCKAIDFRVSVNDDYYHDTFGLLDLNEMWDYVKDCETADCEVYENYDDYAEPADCGFRIENKVITLY